MFAFLLLSGVFDKRFSISGMSKNENGAKTLSQKCQTMTYVTVRMDLSHGQRLA